MSLQMETEEREGFAESRAPSDGLALAEIRDELRAQRAEARRVHGAFAFFAAGALIIPSPTSSPWPSSSMGRGRCERPWDLQRQQRRQGRARVRRREDLEAALLNGGKADEAGNVGEIGSVKPGQTKALKLKLAAGRYALLCNLPGHYGAGQYADLTVK